MRWIVRAVIGMLLVATVWFSWQAYHVYQGVREMTGVAVPRATNEPTVVVPPFNGGKRVNFLVLGSDNDRKREEKRPLTQSMIVVTLDPVHYKVSMLSIPRDFYVPIPGHGMGKIDLAHKYGGIQLARLTVERLFHIPIHYYAWVGLNGFIKVIDTFGGVTLDAQYPVLDDSYPSDLSPDDPYAYKRLFIPAGWQHMDGTRALQYVRSRHGDLVGDFGRSTRQQQVLLQLDGQINALNVVFHLPALVDDLHGSVKTDLSLDQLYQLQGISRHIHIQGIPQVVLQPPIYSQYGWTPNHVQSIVKPNWAKIRQLISRMFAPVVQNGPIHSVRQTRTATAHPVPTPHQQETPITGATVRPVTPVPTATSSPTSTPVPPIPLPSGRLFFEQSGDIYELARTGEVNQITHTGDAAMPAVSPDGRYLAFIRFPAHKYLSDLWILDMRTHALHDLTSAPSKEIRNNLWAAWPSWSADGKQILFSWDKAKLSTAPSDARSIALAIWTVPANGGPAIQMTVPDPAGVGDTQVQSRPHSAQFLYVQWKHLPGSNLPYSQLTLRDGQNVYLLTPPGGRIIDPAWDPSGKRVAFIRRTNGVDEIAVAPILGSTHGPILGPRTVLARGQVAQPAFTPGGHWVSYLRANGDHFECDIVPVSGGRSIVMQSVTTNVDPQWRPVWSR